MGGFLACSHPPQAPLLHPEQERQTFQLAPGLRIELVAAEPMIEDPVAMAFDEAGRLWVVEMRGFMPDIDGTGEEEKVGRVSILLDQNQDGRMDSSVVFLDSLVLPRAIAIVDGGALIAENIPLWFAKDTNGDLRADIKTLVDPEYGGRGIPEHSPNGLLLAMDNWIYNAKSTHRYRRQGQEWIKEETEFRGQWGISQDNQGRLFYNYNWSQLHVDLVPPNYLSQNPFHLSTSGIDHAASSARTIYPIRPNTAVNRGYVPGTLDGRGRLIEYASAAAPFVYRGDALGEEYIGNAFVCEPTGNLIRRNLLSEVGWLISAKQARTRKEFLASTDERFRPILMNSGPDGGLYIVDMYKGIIQHGPYMSTYLREESLERGLDQHINKGRIWRIIPEDWKQSPFEPLAELSPKDWVSFLSHPNGWHRDQVQRLLVEAGDPSVIPALLEVLDSESDQLGRLHAMWTLDGLNYRQPEPYLSLLADSDPLIQRTAIRLLETCAKGNSSLQSEIAMQLKQILGLASEKTRLQMALAANSFDRSKMLPVLVELITDYSASPVMRDAVMSSLEGQEMDMLETLLATSHWDLQSAGKAIFFEMLTVSVQGRGNSEEIAQIEEIINNEDTPDWMDRALLAGLERTIPQKDENQTGNGNPASRNDTDSRELSLGRQQYLTVCSGCHGTDGEGIRRFAPPLVNSEWVSGDEKRLILLALHGMQGPVSVNGIVYDVPEILPVMPSFAVMDNGDLAAILSYIRTSWGNGASAISSSTVIKIRYRTQGKITPWTAEELLQDITIPE